MGEEQRCESLAAGGGGDSSVNYCVTDRLLSAFGSQRPLVENSSDNGLSGPNIQTTNVCNSTGKATVKSCGFAAANGDLNNKLN